MSRFKPLALMLSAIILGAALLAVVLAPAAAARPDTALEVIADGLNGPRHPEFGPDGALYVAEAGVGGQDPCVPNPLGQGQVCYGATGAITRIADGAQEQVVTGLPSWSEPEGPFAGFEGIGPHAITWDAMDQMFAIVGLGMTPTQTLPGGGFEGLNFGSVISATADSGGGSWQPYFSVAATENDLNPDGGALDSNPYDIVATDTGFIVSDAGGNDLLYYDQEGNLSEVLTVFPFTVMNCFGDDIPVQPVPTSVEVNADDEIYVGELTGFCFIPGLADVYRIEEGAPGYTEVYSGFTNITDIAFDGHGNLYVLEMAADNGLLAMFEQLAAFVLNGTPVTEFGRVTRIAPDGTRTVVAKQALVAPTGLTIGPDGYIYASNWGLGQGLGQVVRIAPYQVHLPIMHLTAE